jgi:hypothetical protein
VWLLFAVPVLLVPGWKESVALLVFISIYANVARALVELSGRARRRRPGEPALVPRLSPGLAYPPPHAAHHAALTSQR